MCACVCPACARVRACNATAGVSPCCAALRCGGRRRRRAAGTDRRQRRPQRHAACTRPRTRGSASSSPSRGSAARRRAPSSGPTLPSMAQTVAADGPQWRRASRGDTLRRARAAHRIAPAAACMHACLRMARRACHRRPTGALRLPTGLVARCAHILARTLDAWVLTGASHGRPRVPTASRVPGRTRGSLHRRKLGLRGSWREGADDGVRSSSSLRIDSACLLHGRCTAWSLRRKRHSRRWRWLRMSHGGGKRGLRGGMRGKGMRGARGV